ncbi:MULTISPECIES: phosphotransferase [unclassified Bradyrhizobium]|uniref:phosphotransferase n=1 Tax=unclassified Bradyrhizobium TaxID=2631580 RepID=UPI0028F0E861|nr:MULTISPECIES: phosphotransferase [unclassified Bradyrhizobium]
MQIPEIIPEPRRDAVRAALRATFGADVAGDFQPIRGGVSGALILRFEVFERSYVLRIEPERVALHDRERGYACMVAAANAGVAPAVHFCDPAAGIAIMDFVAARPLSHHPGGAVGAVRALGVLIANVQTTPPFPATLGYSEVIGPLLAHLNTSCFFAPGQLRPHMEGFARVWAALPWDASALVSCHNDPNPRNILFDGERLWLVDWELAFRNDPLVDAAILTTEQADTPELEDTLLQAAFGVTPDAHLRARLHVIRLLTRLFYGCVVLDSLVGRLRSSPEIGIAASSPTAFRKAVAEGRLASGSVETAYAFGQMSLNAFTDGLAASGFDETLKRVAQG